MKNKEGKEEKKEKMGKQRKPYTAPSSSKTLVTLSEHDGYPSKLRHSFGFRGQSSMPASLGLSIHSQDRNMFIWLN